MRSLFLKVFLWFWMAMALVVIVFIGLVTTTQQDRSPGQQRARGPEFRHGPEHGRGPEPGQGPEHETGPEHGHDDNGGAIRGEHFGPPPPDKDHPHPPGGPFRFWMGWLAAQPTTQAFRLLAVLATTGIVCYGLVRHLVTPILELRQATQRLATGDLTARVSDTLGRRRDELGVLGRDFDRMAERIESLMNAQNRLIGDISHELRSPLARVNVALSLVRDTAGPEAADDLDRIELETGRLNTMIGQLLTLSRLESGEQVPQNTPVDLARLVREIAADADFEACSRNRLVGIVVSTSCRISGTESLLRSAIENVVRNAVRYTNPETSVEISLLHEDEGGRMKDEGGMALIHPSSFILHPSRYAVIRVRDHGPGVPEESLALLFRPFYRIADARDRQSGGTGLGLAITERAVRLHGGTVTAANAPGGGLLVEIQLPTAPVSAEL